jgi:hypothetical protein
VLAYLLWHRPTGSVGADVYEQAAQRFHRSLAHSPPAGFRASVTYRTGPLPWLGWSEGYEDWYLVEDFGALGVLNEAAVAHGHRTAHDEIAHRVDVAAGGLYGLLEGSPALDGERTTVWVARPQGAPAVTFAELLADGIDPSRGALLRRSLVLGPAPEYCVLADRPPAGVAATRLPEGWSAAVGERRAIGAEGAGSTGA